MGRIIILLYLILIVGCETEKDYRREYRKISISYPNAVEDNEWFMIDNYLFLHSSQVALDSIAHYDSLLAGNKIEVYLMPVSKNKIKLPDGKVFTEEVIGTVILSHLVKNLSSINDRDSLYMMNLGANLWLSGKLIIERSDKKVLTVTKSNSFRGTLEGN